MASADVAWLILAGGAAVFVLICLILWWRP
jgi:hypothetical protein